MLAGVWQNLKVAEARGSDAAPLASAWRALCMRTLEPSGFQSVDFALPILAREPAQSLATVQESSAIVMAVPLQRQRGLASSATSALTASSLPQVDYHAAEPAVMAFMNSQQTPFLFRSLPMESAFFAILEKAAPQLRVMKRWQRAAVRISGSFEEWQAGNFDQKRRKEFKRLRTRLSEQGRLELETLNQSSALQGFVDDLLELEAKGWKGKRGTAMQADAKAASQFREICFNLHRSGTLRFWTLKFNGKPIASLFGMVKGTQGWIVKIAYDEAFAKYSPGVLLVLDATKALFGEPKLTLVDSCAIPDHPMINRIWRDRIEMADVLVAPAQISTFKFAATAAVLNAHSKSRALVKSIFYHITKRKRS